jgi:hypothetical protein
MTCARYYRRDGAPYSEMLEWAIDHEKAKNKRVAETTLPDGTWISTVWLGSCHTFHGFSGLENDENVHLIFETMVFPSEKNLDERDQTRYTTEAEALKGHEQMVKKWTAAARDGKVNKKIANDRSQQQKHRSKLLI